VKKPSESGLVKSCLDLLKLRGIWAWRENTTGLLRTDSKGRKFWAAPKLKGKSDILGIVPPHGRLLCIECKMPGEEPTPHQALFLAAVHDAGGLAFVVSDVADLKELLDENGL
jgi:hypothetical protein